MKLFKFTTVLSGLPIYVAPDQISYIMPISSPPKNVDPNGVQVYMGDYYEYNIRPPDGVDKGTILVLDRSHTIFVDEHISEVIAIIEERDAYPAKVLFGDKRGTDDKAKIKGNRR